MAIIDLLKYSVDNIIDGTANDHLYIVVGEHKPVNSTYTQTEAEVTTAKNNLIFGKKITSDDYTNIVNRNTWTSNTVYETYLENSNKEYFILNQNNDVYKCIWNANDVVSTSEPITKTNALIETADGYIWKYMYSLTTAQINKFGTSTEIPIFANTSVQANAIPGTIDYIEIVDGGSNFTAYDTGTILGVVSNTVFRIANTASAVANVYSNSAIYITNGTGAGTLKTISTSYSNSIGKYVVLASNTTLSTDSEYIISPRVIVDDRQGTGFEAYTTVANGAIETVEVISPGSYYINPTITLKTANGTGSSVTLTQYLSPIDGHGADPYTELQSNKIQFSVNVLLDEDVTLPNTSFTYYQTGLLYNPNTSVWGQNTVSYGISLDVNTAFTANSTLIGLTSNASGIAYWANSSHVKLNNIVGTFANGETIYLSSNTSVNSAINIIKESDVERASGDLILYANHSDGILRTTGISEDIKFLITLET